MYDLQKTFSTMFFIFFVVLAVGRFQSSSAFCLIGNPNWRGPPIVKLVPNIVNNITKEGNNFHSLFKNHRYLNIKYYERRIFLNNICKYNQVS